jgi:hypothetical protein
LINFVMPALVAGIHVFLPGNSKTWMPGTRPGMTNIWLPEHDAVRWSRHCEERSDEAIQPAAQSWIASLCSQ